MQVQKDKAIIQNRDMKAHGRYKGTEVKGLTVGTKCHK